MKPICPDVWARRFVGRFGQKILGHIANGSANILLLSIRRQSILSAKKSFTPLSGMYMMRIGIYKRGVHNFLSYDWRNKCMNYTSWIIPLIVLAWSGFCPLTSYGEESTQDAPLAWEQLLLTEAEKKASTVSDYPNFSDNPRLTKRMKRLMSPYLLPLNSPLKRRLDQIFSKPGIIKNNKTLKRAGFSILFSQKRSYIVVAKHPKVKGYLFKIYLDSKRVHKDGMRGWELLTTRCIVAKKIKRIIRKKHLRHFTVATKWLYPVPPPLKKAKAKAEPVVLLVKDMKIYNRKASRRVWETKANPRILKELYAVLKRGYGSAFLHGNVPYTKKGKFAFIDTEYAKRKIPLPHVKHFLSKKMKIYWDRLTSRCPKKHGIYVQTQAHPVG